MKLNFKCSFLLSQPTEAVANEAEIITKRALKRTGSLTAGESPDYIMCWTRLHSNLITRPFNKTHVIIVIRY